MTKRFGTEIIGAVVVIIGVAFIVFLAVNINKNTETLSEHNVDVGGRDMSLQFNQDATTKTVNANQTILKGDDLNGSPVVLSIQSEESPAVSPALCEGEDTKTPISANQSQWQEVANTTVMNTPAVVCGYKATDTSAANASTYTEVKIGNTWYCLDFTSTSPSQPVDLNTVNNVIHSLST